MVRNMTIKISVWKKKYLHKRNIDISLKDSGRHENIDKQCTAALLSLFSVGVIWHYSTVLNSEMMSHVANDNQTIYVTGRISQRYEAISLNEISSEDPQNTNQLKEILEREEKDPEPYLENDTPRDLREILGNHYEGSKLVYQQRAFKRVLRWKEDFRDIVKSYRNVDWKKLSAIIKAETQGRTGKQVSSAKAIGMPQIKYQGAWAFLWNAMFSERSRQGSAFVKDYYNANIRARYKGKLKQIRHYLEENNILLYPANSSKTAYRKARYESWENLKTHLERRFKPGEYQVAVDIAAMYIDHLVYTFKKIKRQVEEIKEYVECKGTISLYDIKSSGIEMTRWKRIKKYLLKDIKSMDNANLHQLTLARLNDILDRLEDPNICSAAYNFGISKVLRYTESGRKMPEAIEGYVKKVSTYDIIFNEIERFSAYS